jgi:hypothetical protein
MMIRQRRSHQQRLHHHQNAVKGNPNDHKKDYPSYGNASNLALGGVTGSAKALALQHSGSSGLVDGATSSGEDDDEGG